MNRLHRNTFLNEWQGLTVKIRKLRVFIAFMIGEALKHQAVAHQYAYTVLTANLISRHGHSVKRIHHYLHLGSVVRRDQYRFLAIGKLIRPGINTLWPWHHFVVCHHWIQ